MAQIIVYSGSHGIGKTTAIRNSLLSLAADEQEVLYMNEAARDCPYPLDEYKAYEWMLKRSREQLALAVKARALGVTVLMDRCPLDYKIYALARGHIEGINARKMARELAVIDRINFLRTHGREFMFVCDGFRDMDPGFRDEVDTLMAREVMCFAHAVEIKTHVGIGANKAA